MDANDDWPIVARVVPATSVEGPGLRTAIWVAGCTIRCPGCFNDHLFEQAMGRPTRHDQIIQTALAHGVEGISLLGGEPFDQASRLVPLAVAAQRAGLGVVTFTGYTFGALISRVRRGDSGTEALLRGTDLLLDGPYMRDRPERHRPWIGSTNQGFRYLSTRYEWIAESLPETLDALEVRVLVSGEVQINGWAPSASLESLLAALRA